MRRVTIKDIAQIAGVSYATVSRALSGSPEISEQTRSRILDICRKEGYRANVLARSLIRSKTNVLGLIIPDVTNPFYSELSLGIETYARSLGYNVMLCNSLRNDDTTAQLFDFLIGHQVDGIILANSYSEAKNWVHKYSSAIPIVLLSDAIDDSEGGGINAVSVDNLEGGRLAAEYLYALGHRKILYFGFRPSSVTHQMRFRGFCKALDSFGIVPEIIENPADSSSIAKGASTALRSLRQPIRLRSAFCRRPMNSASPYPRIYLCLDSTISSTPRFPRLCCPRSISANSCWQRQRSTS